MNYVNRAVPPILFGLSRITNGAGLTYVMNAWHLLHHLCTVSKLRQGAVRNGNGSLRDRFETDPVPTTDHNFLL